MNRKILRKKYSSVEMDTCPEEWGGKRTKIIILVIAIIMLFL
jgi:hypothetical protein